MPLENSVNTQENQDDQQHAQVDYKGGLDGTCFLLDGGPLGDGGGPFLRGRSGAVLGLAEIVAAHVLEIV